MHNEKFFISWLDDEKRMYTQEVTGLSGLIAELWLIYSDRCHDFSTVRINVIPNK